MFYPKLRKSFLWGAFCLIRLWALFAFLQMIPSLNFLRIVNPRHWDTDQRWPLFSSPYQQFEQQIIDDLVHMWVTPTRKLKRVNAGIKTISKAIVMVCLHVEEHVTLIGVLFSCTVDPKEMFKSLIFKHISFVISAKMKTLRLSRKIQVPFRIRKSCVCENTKAKLWYCFEHINIF